MAKALKGSKQGARIHRLEVRSLAFDQPGKMVDEITVTDPATYYAPWKTTVEFERVPDGDLGWHVCTEKLYPMPADARPGPPPGDAR